MSRLLETQTSARGFLKERGSFQLWEERRLGVGNSFWEGGLLVRKAVDGRRKKRPHWALWILSDTSMFVQARGQDVELDSVSASGRGRDRIDRWKPIEQGWKRLSWRVLSSKK